MPINTQKSIQHFFKEEQIKTLKFISTPGRRVTLWKHMATNTVRNVEQEELVFIACKVEKLLQPL